MNTRTCEREFMLDCLRARWDASALDTARAVSAQPGFEWDAFLDLAQHEDLTPLLYAAVRAQDLVPEEIEAALRADYFGNARRNLLLFKQLETVLQRLDAADVPVLVLKGVALAETVYENPALRPMCDADLLVREDDVPQALDTLSSLSYTIIPPLAYRCEVLLREPEHGIAPIELHWGLFVSPRAQYGVATDWLWETALPCTVGNTSTLMLGPEAQLLHLCGHLVLHHGNEESRVLWLYDIAEVLVKYGPLLKWDKMLDQAKRAGLVEAIARILTQAIERWALSVPESVRISLWNLESEQATTSRDISRTQRLLADTFGTGGTWRSLYFLWRNLFPPAAYMRALYRVSNPILVPLYYPYRWFLGLQSLFP